MYSSYLTNPCTMPKPMPNSPAQLPTVLWNYVCGKMPTPRCTMHTSCRVTYAHPSGCM